MLHVGLDLRCRRVDMCLVSSEGELVDHFRARSLCSCTRACSPNENHRDSPASVLRSSFSLAAVEAAHGGTREPGWYPGLCREHANQILNVWAPHGHVLTDLTRREPWMRRMFERCAALDVHKKQLTACARILTGGGEIEELTAEFSTMAADLLALRDWLKELGVTHVAMEATGVYWRPVVRHEALSDRVG